MDIQELFDKVHFELLLKYTPNDIEGNEDLLESTIELTKQVLLLHGVIKS